MSSGELAVEIAALQLELGVAEEDLTSAAPPPGTPSQTAQDIHSVAACHLAKGTQQLGVRPSARKLYILELYSGHGSVSMTASTILESCPVITVDASTSHGEPTLCAVLPRDNQMVIDHCKTVYPDRAVVIWASPDCRHYSRAKTTGERDLETADANVQAVRDIAMALQAAVVIIENPATGMLVGRDVIAFMPFSYKVNYCKYGFSYPKPTMLWCSHRLPLHGFQPETCNFDCHCTYTAAGVKRHLTSVTDHPVGVRISVPVPLVVSVFRAVRAIVDSLPGPVFDPQGARRARADDVGVVDEIQGVRGAGQHVEVLVAWYGHDHSDWIHADQLDGCIEVYDFRCESLREQCILLLKP